MGVADRNQNSANNGDELSFARLSRPAIYLLAIAAVSLIGLIVLASAAQNILSRQHSLGVAASIVRAENRRLADITKDYAWWGETLEQAKGKLDPIWLDDNLGAYIRDQQDVSDGFIIGPDGNIIYRIALASDEPITNVKSHPDLAQLWQLALANGVTFTTPPAGFVAQKSRPYLASASVIFEPRWLGDNGKPVADAPIPPEGQRYVLVFMRDLDQGWLVESARSFGLSEAYLSIGGHIDHSRTSANDLYPVVTFSGRVVAHLGWKPERPGDHMLMITIPMVLVVLAGIAFLARLILQRWMDLARRLADREARLDVVISSMSDGLLVLDEAGLIVQANPAACQLLGYQASQLVGRASTSMFAPDDADHIRTMMDQYFRNHSGKQLTLQREVVARRHDGTLFPLEVGLAELVFGESRHYAVLLHNIDERKRSEQALLDAKGEVERKSQAKDELLASIVREMRPPLNAILSYADLAASGPLNAKQSQAITHVKRGAESILHLIQDLMELGDPQAFRPVIELKPTELSQVLSVVEQWMGPELASREQVLQVEVGENVPCRVMADGNRLRQILSQLLSNATKFTPRGGTIILKLEMVEQNQTLVWLRFSCIDNGVGIAPIHHQRIFDRFVQISPDGTARPEGPGLGLSIAQSLANAMGSRVEVDSAPGQGSHFWFDVGFRPVESQASPDATGKELPKELMPS